MSYIEYKKECEYCGKIFVAHSNKGRYCTKKCKDIALRLKKGINCNPNTEPFHKVCVICGREFESFRERSITCSSECAYIYRHPSVRNNNRQKSMEEWVKEKQGEHFEYVSSDRSKKGLVRLKCRICGNEIERTKNTVRRWNIECEYCKEKGSLLETRRKMMCFFSALINSKTPRNCMVCGNEYYSSYSGQKYCSPNCKRKSKSRKNSYKNRCRKYGVYYDSSVTRNKVIRRDRNICQICGKQCDQNDLRWGWSGPDFPTLDHIIPLAKGGTHTWNNVQCACGICNSNKRDLVDTVS